MASQSPAPPEGLNVEENAERTDGGASSAVTADGFKIMKGIVDYLTEYKDAEYVIGQRYVC